jgi:hypothetical protein|tara:strand:+ start:370 stop:576 length:207 start_codon:yes stop_codon:yes gene_type:complete
MYKILSKIKEKAKNEDTKARIVVRRIIAPIAVYFTNSNPGHLTKISLLAPEQNIRNLDNRLNFYFLTI